MGEYMFVEKLYNFVLTYWFYYFNIESVPIGTYTSEFVPIGTNRFGTIGNIDFFNLYCLFKKNNF